MQSQISPPLFADVLMQGMLDVGPINSSELARRVWGTMTDNRGYQVARNRDRIGRYLRGTSYPNSSNLQKIADALGVPRAALEVSRRSVTTKPMFCPVCGSWRASCPTLARATETAGMWCPLLERALDLAPPRRAKDER